MSLAPSEHPEREHEEQEERAPVFPAAPAFADTTSVIAAHTAYGQVIEELRRREAEMDRLFERLDEAKAQLRERASVEVTPLLSRPMNAAYAAWSNRNRAGDDAGDYRTRAEGEE
jgi:hypothetical protein